MIGYLLIDNLFSTNDDIDKGTEKGWMMKGWKKVGWCKDGKGLDDEGMGKGWIMKGWEKVGWWWNKERWDDEGKSDRTYLQESQQWVCISSSVQVASSPQLSTVPEQSSPAWSPHSQPTDSFVV